MPTIVFQGDATGVRRATSQATQDVKRLGSSVAGALGAVGVGLSAGALVAGLKSVVSEMDNIADAAKRMDVGTDELQVLTYAAKRTGAEMGDVENAIRRMNRVIGDAANGDAAAAQKLAMLGLSAKELLALPMAERFSLIARSIAAVGDTSVRSAVAQDMLGKSADKLIPMFRELSRLSDEAKAGGLIIDAAAIEAADKFNDQLLELENRIKALVGRSGFVGWLADVTEAMNQTTRETAPVESGPEQLGLGKRVGLTAALYGAAILDKFYGAMSQAGYQFAGWATVQQDIEDIYNRLYGGGAIATGATGDIGRAGIRAGANLRALKDVDPAVVEENAAAMATDAAAAAAAAGDSLRALKDVSNETLLEQQERLDKEAADRAAAAGEAMRALKDVSPEAVVEAAADMAATNVPTRWSSSTFGGALTRVGGDAGRVMDFAQASLDTRRNELLQQIAENTAQGPAFP